jgi:hypothetical protein
MAMKRIRLITEIVTQKEFVGATLVVAQSLLTLQTDGDKPRPLHFNLAYYY